MSKNMPESEMPSTSSQQEVSSIDPRKSRPKVAWADNSPTDEQKSKSKAGAFFKKKWRAVKSSISRRGNKVVRTHRDQHEDEPQPGPSGLGSAHSEQGSDPCGADPSPADQPKAPQKNSSSFLRKWQAVKKAFKVSRRCNQRVSTEPDQDPATPQQTPYERHVFYQRPVPHPSDPEPPHGLYLTDPRPFGFLEDFEERYGELCKRYHAPQSRVTRRTDGQQVGIRYVEKRLSDRFITIPGYDKPLHSELALNVLLSKPPRAQHVEQMCEWFHTKRSLVMVMENLQPFKTLRAFVQGKQCLLTEAVARAFMIQAVMGEKECFDRGVFHQGLSLDSILINPKTLKLHITDFSKGTFVDTADFDISQYSGKSLPVEYKKRARYIAEVETVWSLGSLLYMMLVGRLPYWDEDGKATETLIFEYTARKAPPTQKEKNFFKRTVQGLLEKKLGAPNLDERFSLSRECQDLIRRCLNRSEVHRATLQQIREHEWFRVQLEPKPVCPLPRHKARPTPPAFTGQYEKGEPLVLDRMWSCTRKVDGQNFIMKHSKHSSFDQCVFLADYNTCMDTEVGLNMEMQQCPSSHGVLQMESAFKHSSGHILVFRHPGPCRSLKIFLKRKGGRVSEHMAREFMVQAAMAVKDCIDWGVYHKDITLGNFLVNTETRQLLLHNFSKGQLVDTVYDSSLYRGKALPVEFKKRERYLAEASVVSALGCMLYTMVNGSRPRVTKRGCGTDKLKFRNRLSRECQDLIIRCLNQKVIHRATIQELLEHEWFQVDLPDHKESGFFVQLRKWRGRMM